MKTNKIIILESKLLKRTGRADIVYLRIKVWEIELNFTVEVNDYEQMIKYFLYLFQPIYFLNNYLF